MIMVSSSTSNPSGNTTTPSSCPCKYFVSSLSSATAAEYGDIAALSRRIAVSSSSGRRSTHGSSGGGSIRGIMNNGGITPLHLAAQHGHALAVAFLLETGHVDVDTGRTTDSDDEGRRWKNGGGREEEDGSSGGGGGVTPLHRAAFSGAISTMQQLISHGADLLAKDTSFGDERTPLHKAVAGGRPVAVKLILVTLLKNNGRMRKGNTSSGDGEEDTTTELVMQAALEAKDANGQTPIDLARYYCTKLNSTQLENEKRSVRRWDVVAGGECADWNACLGLLEEEGRRRRRDVINNEEEEEESTRLNNIVSSALWCNDNFFSNQLEKNSDYHPKESNGNLDYGYASLAHNETSLCRDGRCCNSANFISKWESEFRKALFDTSLSLSNEAPPRGEASPIENPRIGYDDDNNHVTRSLPLQLPMQEESVGDANDEDHSNDIMLHPLPSERKVEMSNACFDGADESTIVLQNNKASEIDMNNTTSKTIIIMGRQCENCSQHSIALYRSALTTSRLVCQKCRRRKM